MNNKDLISKTRDYRLRIARFRAREIAHRYPEIVVSEVDPIDDNMIIEAALLREMAHQKRVLDDIQQAGGDI